MTDNSTKKPWLNNTVELVNKIIVEEDDFLQGIAQLHQNSNEVIKANHNTHKRLKFQQ